MGQRLGEGEIFLLCVCHTNIIGVIARSKGIANKLKPSDNFLACTCGINKVGSPDFCHYLVYQIEKM